MGLAVDALRGSLIGSELPGSSIRRILRMADCSSSNPTVDTA